MFSFIVHRWKELLLLISFVTTGLILSYFLYDDLMRKEKARIGSEFDRIVHDYGSAFNQELRGALRILDHVKTFMDINPNASLEEFFAFSHKLFPNNGAIYAIFWMPYVSDASRSAFEKTLSITYGRNISIRDRLDSGIQVVSQTREAYFPLLYTEPPWLRSNVGLDISTVQFRLESMLAGARNNEPSASRGLPVVSQIDNSTSSMSVVVFQPVYQNLTVDPSVQDRLKHLFGFAAIVLRLDMLALASFGHLQCEIIMQIYDITGTSQLLQQIVANSSSGGCTIATNSSLRNLHSELYGEADYLVGGRNWSLIFSGSSLFVNQRQSPLPLTVFGGCLGGVIFMFFVLMFTLGSVEIQYRRELKVKGEQKNLEHCRALERIARVAAESATLANQRFVSYVFHEARVPFNALLLGIENIAVSAGRAGRLNSDDNEVLTIMQSSANRVSSILNNVLDMQKLEAGKFQINVQPFSVEDMIDAIFQHWNPSFKEKCLTVKKEVEEQALVTVQGDFSKLVQCLSIFVSNAIKFTPIGGTISVALAINTMFQEDLLRDEAQTEVRLCKYRPASIRPAPDILTFPHYVPHPNKFPSSSIADHCKILPLTFTVDDTGTGLEESQIENLFRPYRQVTTTGEKEMGTGLGLALTKNIVELHGGRVGVQSCIGVGSRFFFTIPFHIVPSSISSSCMAKTTSTLSGTRVLVVDDSQLNLKMLGRMLNQYGMQCDFAGNGQEALLKCHHDATDDMANHSSAPYDLIVMDQHMPVMTGTDATRQLRGWGLKTPVIALTGDPCEEKEFLLAGADAVLSKPLQKEDFLRTIDQLIKPYPH